MTKTAGRTVARPKAIKNREKPIQKTRLAIQAAFSALCVWIGVEMLLFVRYLESGGARSFVERPPGVDGFLPISSLMNLYYWMHSGEIHPYHPAGLFILLAIILVSLVFGKAFCSWLCPVGLISETVGDLGKKLFGRTIRVWRWLDYPLRSLKYLLLGFFAYSIFFLMNEIALKRFLDSPYNLVSDIKMYYFFADISQFALIVVGVLLLLSIVVRNFWCRYLCPYGALLGLTSLLSPHKIKRDPISCIDCGKCAKACPSSIKVDKVKTVISDECTTCLNCVDVCPVANTLYLQSTATKKPVNKRLVAVGIVAIFMLVTGIGIVSGNWQNDITPQQYLQHQGSLHSYGHPTRTDDIERLRHESPDAQQSAVSSPRR
ncbi:4Fe-4S binding protein [candidate division GN15 bacterium]|nr:4Fe-4S binding protein [candidate division GN15 bacterium]